MPDEPGSETAREKHKRRRDSYQREVQEYAKKIADEYPWTDDQVDRVGRLLRSFRRADPIEVIADRRVFGYMTPEQLIDHATGPVTPAPESTQPPPRVSKP